MAWGKCNQCGHEWQTRGQKTPVACPACKRYDWQEPKKGNRGGDERAQAVEFRGAKAAVQAQAGTEDGPAGRQAGNGRVERERSPATGTKAEGVSVHSGAEYLAPWEEPERLPECRACEDTLREIKGKWICLNQACAEYGREQKGRR
jgi:hypothetical protein